MNTNDIGAAEGRLDIRHLSATQLASLGLSQIAYLRPVTVNGERAYSIHAADGTPMALAGDLAPRGRRGEPARDGRRPRALTKGLP